LSDDDIAVMAGMVEIALYVNRYMMHRLRADLES